MIQNHNMDDLEKQKHSHPTQFQYLDRNVQGVEETLKVMNEKMKSHSKFLKILGDNLNLKVTGPNIYPIKGKFPSHEMHRGHMLQDNSDPYFQDHFSFITLFFKGWNEQV